MIETILKNFHIEMETIKDKIEAIDVRTVNGILAGLIKLRKISVHQRLFKSAATLVRPYGRAMAPNGPSWEPGTAPTPPTTPLATQLTPP